METASKSHLLETASKETASKEILSGNHWKRRVNALVMSVGTHAFVPSVPKGVKKSLANVDFTGNFLYDFTNVYLIVARHCNYKYYFFAIYIINNGHVFYE